MHKKPTVHILRTVGFLAFTLELSGALACKIQDQESDLPGGLQVTEGSVNDQLVLACENYCGHIYSSATDCSPELLEQEGAGCEAFCGIQAKSVPDQCEALLLEHYECVVIENIPYSCEDEDSSPQPLEESCEEMALTAEDCLSGLSSTG